MTASQPRHLTGRMVFIIAVSCFAAVLAPNVLLMVFAIDTFSGLVVPNSYVASQEFDERKLAQEALGWNVEIQEADGQIDLSIRDIAGNPVRPESVSLVVGRTTTERDDVPLTLVPTASGFAAPTDLEPGLWQFDLEAVALDGTRFSQRRNIVIKRRQ